MLKIQKIKKSFSDNCVLKGVDLYLPKGGVTALIGPSGSGKSTLLRCVNCLVNADDGELILDGKNINLKHITSKDKTFLRRNTAMVFQNFNLFNNKTVIENIMEGLIFVQKKQKDEAREIAIQLLERIGLKEKANEAPSALSGGQQQRVAIARAIADEVCFLDGGNIIERGLPDAVIGNPQNPRTQQFLSKILVHK